MIDILDTAGGLDVNDVSGWFFFTWARELLDGGSLFGRLFGLELPVVMHVDDFHSVTDLFAGLTLLISVGKVDHFIEFKVVLLEFLNVNLRVREPKHDESANRWEFSIFIRRQNEILNAQVVWWVTDRCEFGDLFGWGSSLLKLLTLATPSLSRFLPRNLRFGNLIFGSLSLLVFLLHHFLSVFRLFLPVFWGERRTWWLLRLWPLHQCISKFVKHPREELPRWERLAFFNVFNFFRRQPDHRLIRVNVVW